VFQNFQSLEYLDLSSNQIRDIEPNTFEDSQKLKFLDLSKNLIDRTKNYACLKFLPGGIEVLKIGGNYAVSLTWKELFGYVGKILGGLKEFGFWQVGLQSGKFVGSKKGEFLEFLKRNPEMALDKQVNDLRPRG
jgi:hypothetical protein